MNPPSSTTAPLGRHTTYPDHYDASLLFPIARQANRSTLPFVPDWAGTDIWNAYELSWLNPKGKPQVATGRFTVPANSPNLIESKSFKLYLNSFNDAAFNDLQTVQDIMARDLSQAAGAPVQAHIQPLGPAATETLGALPGVNIDHLDVTVSHYTPAPQLLHCVPGAGVASETLVSDLLKSNCPVTGQPDWGTVQIQYRGPKIDHAGLLQYIISLRRHQEFHEHCVEQMYCDIWRACQPEALTVYARYTRRGGLDINPWRASAPGAVDAIRTVRQ
jgi:7-cyano-7-deazaguanine reductase